MGTEKQNGNCDVTLFQIAGTGIQVPLWRNLEPTLVSGNEIDFYFKGSELES